MSSIATRRIEAGLALGARAEPELRVLATTLILAVFWISFEPFSGGGEGLAMGAVEKSGNLINQVGFLGLFAVALVFALSASEPMRLARLLSLPWLAMLAWIAVSTTSTPDPSAAQRAFVFVTIVIALSALSVVLVRNASQFARAVLLAGGAVLALSYAGLALFPVNAIHQGFELESQHAGLWRGVFTHKNIAGPVMASLVFAGIWMIRRGGRVAGALLTLAALIFVLKSGSKTTVALVPAVIILVALPAVMGMRWLSALAVLAAAAAAHALTIGTVFVPALDAVLRSVSDTTFTGRTEIWAFAGDYVAARPWTGYGLYGFWETPVTLEAEAAFDRSWDPRKIIHGHNGFLDVALYFGLPGLVMSIWLIAIAPAIAYARTPRLRENALMADFFFMIVAFCLMNAALESFFFQRSDPVWLTLVIALFGLRITSRFAMNRAQGLDPKACQPH